MVLFYVDVMGDPSNALGSWKDIISSQYASSKPFSLSYIPLSFDEVSFSQDNLIESIKEWDLSLVGYSIGKRPYYASLLTTIKRKWSFKGSMDLLTLEGDFFLFKFSCKEDYDSVWDNGPCFLNGRPFLFQKWKYDFRPSKDKF